MTRRKTSPKKPERCNVVKHDYVKCVMDPFTHVGKVPDMSTVPSAAFRDLNRASFGAVAPGQTLMLLHIPGYKSVISAIIAVDGTVLSLVPTTGSGGNILGNSSKGRLVAGQSRLQYFGTPLNASGSVSVRNFTPNHYGDWTDLLTNMLADDNAVRDLHPISQLGTGLASRLTSANPADGFHLHNDTLSVISASTVPGDAVIPDWTCTAYIIRGSSADASWSLSTANVWEVVFENMNGSTISHTPAADHSPGILHAVSHGLMQTAKTWLIREGQQIFRKFAGTVGTRANLLLQTPLMLTG